MRSNVTIVIYKIDTEQRGRFSGIKAIERKVVAPLAALDSWRI